MWIYDSRHFESSPHNGYQPIEEVEHEQDEGFVEENTVEFIRSVSESLRKIESVESEDDKAKFVLDEHLEIVQSFRP